MVQNAGALAMRLRLYFADRVKLISQRNLSISRGYFLTQQALNFYPGDDSDAAHMAPEYTKVPG